MAGQGVGEKRGHSQAKEPNSTSPSPRSVCQDGSRNKKQSVLLPIRASHLQQPPGTPDSTPSPHITRLG